MKQKNVRKIKFCLLLQLPIQASGIAFHNRKRVELHQERHMTHGRKGASEETVWVRTVVAIADVTNLGRAVPDLGNQRTSRISSAIIKMTKTMRLA